jgi:hypothetical protein
MNRNATSQHVISTKVVLSRHYDGVIQPQVEIEIAKGLSYRVRRAALHTLAAKIELATPSNEGWCVQIEHVSDTHGYVYLELIHATPAEAERGMALLRKVIAEAGRLRLEA